MKGIKRLSFISLCFLCVFMMASCDIAGDLIDDIGIGKGSFDEISYDSNGNRIETHYTTYRFGKVKIKEYETVYDVHDVRLKMTTFSYYDDDDFRKDMEYEYYSDGRISKEKCFNIFSESEGYKYIYEYDRLGNKTLIKEFDYDENVTKWIESEYDARSLLIKLITRDSNGFATNTEVNEYDSNGNIEKKSKYLNADNLVYEAWYSAGKLNRSKQLTNSQWWETEYYSNYTRISKTRVSDDSLEEIIERYNEGKIVTKKYDERGAVSSWEVKEFDSEGKELRITCDLIGRYRYAYVYVDGTRTGYLRYEYFDDTSTLKYLEEYESSRNRAGEYVNTIKKMYEYNSDGSLKLILVYTSRYDYESYFYTMYNADGMKNVRDYYEDGTTPKTDTLYSANGVINMVTRYDRNGDLASITNYDSNGKPIGTSNF